MNSFEGLNLSSPILQALKSKGYTIPTPVQLKAIPLVLEGRDLFGSAQTGTGKTAAFALPLLHLMSTRPSQHRSVRTLVLAPTRELAIQIGDSFRDYGRNLGMRHVVIYGGVSQHTQTMALRKGVDIIVATPGRLLDLMEQGFVKLNDIEFLVLDEADRMLDMGFITDIKRIVAKIPVKRQTMLFSATIPQQIKKLAHDLLKNPASVDIKPEFNELKMVKQQVYLVDKNDKTGLLCDLISTEPIGHALIFTRTRRGADKLVKSLNMKGIRSQAIHGDKSQSQRQRVLADFKSKKVHMLVATDVASRGIDVKDLSHVINFDLPEGADTYTHRIGRTGRAGAAGVALSFCSREEQGLLKEIQRFSSEKIAVIRHNGTGKEMSRDMEKESFDAPKKVGYGAHRTGSSDRNNVSFGDRKTSLGERKNVSFGERKKSGFGARKRIGYNDRSKVQFAERTKVG
ncbi:MAG: DEAD/DEAH box helicase [Chitinophagales bacterium]